MDFRSIKTLLSANQAQVWDDVEVILNNDIISTSNHNKATIKKKAKYVF